MLVYHNQGFYTSTLLAGFPFVVHGFSTKKIGDMRRKEQRDHFANLLGLSDVRLTLSKQVHGSLVSEVKENQQVEIIDNADALIFKADRSRERALVTRVADCCPMLFLEAKKRIAAVAHAGWRGTLTHISKKVIDSMLNLGGRIENIFVCIGPHIGMCCYTVPRERAMLFEKAFGKNERIVANFLGSYRIDIGYANYCELLALGLKKEHIDTPVTCTACQSDIFYSYRRTTDASFGEIAGMIAIVK